MERGGLSWWDARTLLRLGRWSWPASGPAAGGDGDASFRVAEAVVLTSNLSGAATNGPVRGGGRLAAGGGGGAHGDAAGGGDGRPCLACVSADGEVRILRLGGVEGAEELHRAAAAAGAVPGTRAGVVTVPSPSRHQFLLVTRYVWT